MKIYYISPSTIFSRTANSIHVVNMCDALANIGNKIKLFAHIDKHSESPQNYYNVNLKRIELNLIKLNFSRGKEFFIFLNCLVIFLFDLISKRKPDLIISRNLYGALVFGLFFRQIIIYESHAPENGFRKFLQKLLLCQNNIKPIVISDALKSIIKEYHNITGDNITILHDAAKFEFAPLSNTDKYELKKKVLSNEINLDKYEIIVGYFGHLYQGRGIDIIQELAQKKPNIAFVVYGGNETQIKELKNNNLNNLFIMGFISPKNVRTHMAMMDVLLMPYQNTVSIGVKDVDTAKWMSPLKLFEYLSCATPIISSDLPVLREVLFHEKNCLLASPSDINSWLFALERITQDSKLSKYISNNAYNDFIENYTWEKRAEKMIALSIN